MLELGDLLVLRLDGVGEGFGFFRRQAGSRGLTLASGARCRRRARQGPIDAGGIGIGEDEEEIGAGDTGQHEPEGGKQPRNPTA